MVDSDKGIIYIDANTGTWGGAENLLLLEVGAEDVEYLEECSDSEINQFATDGGGEPVMSIYEAASWINSHVSHEAREEFLARFDPEEA